MTAVTARLAAVLWDMDGTLVDSEKLWDVSLYEVANWLGGTLTEEKRRELVGSNLAKTSRFVLQAVGRTVDDDSVAMTSGWIRSRTMELFSAALPWRPGAREALAAVRAAGVPSALVTSTERVLTERALDSIGRDFFDVTVCGDEVEGRHKPHPEPYLRAARMLDVDPDACVAVEDSPTGADSAEAAGAAVLVVPCDVEVPGGARRRQRDSLVGVDVDTLLEVLADVTG